MFQMTALCWVCTQQEWRPQFDAAWPPPRLLLHQDHLRERHEKG